MGQEEAPKTKPVFQEPGMEFVRIALNDEEQEKDFCPWATCLLREELQDTDFYK